MMLLRLDNKPRTHDYTKSMWGHALLDMVTIPVFSRPSLWQRIRGAQPEHISNELQCSGFGDVRQDDFILTKMASGKVARWKVEDVEHLRNPDDMFHIHRASFVGYEGED